MGCGASVPHKLTQAEQLRVETQKGVKIYRGPQIVYLSTWNPPLKEEVQQIINLEAHEYATIRDTLKTELRTETGPKRFFLEAYEELVEQAEAISLSQTEFCYVKDPFGRVRLIKGPCRFVPDPAEEALPKQKAITLDHDMYVKVKDLVTGHVRVDRGPALFIPQPADEMLDGGPRRAVQVDRQTSVLVKDILEGTLHLVQDEGLFFPRAQDEIVQVRKFQDMIKLDKDDYAVIRDTLKNELRLELGEQRFFLQVHEELVRKDAALLLSANEYCYVEDGTGTKRIVKGPARFIPGAYEKSTGAKQAITLGGNTYVRLRDCVTGEIRVHRGPQLVFPDATDMLLDKGPQKAVQVDSETAVLVRDLQHGHLHLVQEHGLFFPRPQDEIVKVQQLIRLQDHDAVVMKNESGAFQYFYGSDSRRGDQPRAFFLPPYCELVEHVWSRGRRRQTRDLRITHLDMRPQFMNFEFNSRTSDNVELVLEGTFYWELCDIPTMLTYTGDVTGDICNYARSTFIQKIAQVTLKQFMDGFRKIAADALQEASGFYVSRGLKVHSLEVTGYRCAEAATANILQQMIQETTNRMNRTSQQESENELKMNKIHGEIEQEKARGELLAIRHEHMQKEAAAAGSADADRAAQFLQSLEGVVPDVQDRVNMWRILRKQEAIGELSKGKAHLYFTPSDVNLSIEDRAS